MCFKIVRYIVVRVCIPLGYYLLYFLASGQYRTVSCEIANEVTTNNQTHTPLNRTLTLNERFLIFTYQFGNSYSKCDNYTVEDLEELKEKSPTDQFGGFVFRCYLIGFFVYFNVALVVAIVWWIKEHWFYPGRPEYNCQFWLWYLTTGLNPLWNMVCCCRFPKPYPAYPEAYNLPPGTTWDEIMMDPDDISAHEAALERRIKETLEGRTRTRPLPSQLGSNWQTTPL